VEKLHQFLTSGVGEEEAEESDEVEGVVANVPIYCKVSIYLL
jgi:hypothetical protein